MELLWFWQYKVGQELKKNYRSLPMVHKLDYFTGTVKHFLQLDFKNVINTKMFSRL